MGPRVQRAQNRVDALQREIDELKHQIGSKQMAKSKSVFEFWRRPNGSGCYHERMGGNVKTTSQHTYSRARDAARQARRDAKRVGARVAEIAAPKARKRRSSR